MEGEEPGADERQEGGSGGVFLEMGAGDGVLFSNSLLFERCFGWHGGILALVSSVSLPVLSL